MPRKYKLTDETQEYGGRILYRIEAIRRVGAIEPGKKGGWVEGEHNLNHFGDCWVADNAICCDDAVVSGNAWVMDSAVVCHNAYVGCIASVCGESLMCDESILTGAAILTDNAIMCDKSKAYGNATIQCHAMLCEQSTARGFSVIGGTAVIDGDRVFDNFDAEFSRKNNEL